MGSATDVPASFHNERSRSGGRGSGREAREGRGVGAPVADSCSQKTSKFRKANILQLKKLSGKKKASNKISDIINRAVLKNSFIKTFVL